MSERVNATLPLRRWQGDRGTYHLVIFEGEQAEALAIHAQLHRLEFGHQRGFGSIKVMARIGETAWKTSVFPQKSKPPSSSGAVGQQKTWVLLVSRKVMRLEDLAEGNPIQIELDLL